MVSQREFSAVKKLVISVSHSLQGKAQSSTPFPAWPSYKLVSDTDWSSCSRSSSDAFHTRPAACRGQSVTALQFFEINVSKMLMYLKNNNTAVIHGGGRCPVHCPFLDKTGGDLGEHGTKPSHSRDSWP